MVVEQIEQLLAAPSSGAGAPTLAHMEDTLTEGYAHALALEAERWRIERRLGEVAAEAPARVEELRSLGTRLRTAEHELLRLRSLLGSLHERARLARAAAKA